ncbi:M15 family metallopeptidase [Clostridium transplantifaecale]|uniref:M15 family metallopeptidase n=1 Tax=Clostridium transplantifaecale TaxID=2479838 RepID=UPI000F632C6A|nr:M15 family metallopeptidase [Clostridium transplantifaecale]
MKNRDRWGIHEEDLNGSGRGGRFNTTWLLAGILAVLLVVAAVIYMNQTSRTGGRTNGAGSELSESLNGGEPGNENVRDETGATASLPSGTGENGTETEAEMETETEPETEETTEAVPVQLESLSGLAPGTILEPEQINFDGLSRYFMSWKIEEGDNLYDRINGKSYRANNHVPLSSLRYLKMPHYNFRGQIQVGEMIVNKDIQEDVFSIFTELFKAKYQIQSMYLVDNYWTGDAETSDSASIDENNTSAFCYREISGGGNLSNHAYGRAIDLNPQQNPYVSYSSGSPRWSHSNANDYIARDTGLPHVITHEDLAYKLFTKRGFRWGGDWNTPKDYQHFDKNNK